MDFVLYARSTKSYRVGSPVRAHVYECFTELSLYERWMEVAVNGRSDMFLIRVKEATPNALRLAALFQATPYQNEDWYSCPLEYK